MIPLKDINRTRTFPAITLLLMAVNATVFVYQLFLGSGPGLTGFFYQFGLVPRALLSLGYWQDAGILQGLAPLLTSMFLHGGWMHFLGNMLYLWVFGDNVEDWLGSLRFLLFYLVCGLLASLLQIAVHPGSPIPMIGASGAISGVLAAYLVLFPGARVLTFVPILFFFYLVRLPALMSSDSAVRAAPRAAAWAASWGAWAALSALLLADGLHLRHQSERLAAQSEKAARSAVPALEIRAGQHWRTALGRWQSSHSPQARAEPVEPLAARLGRLAQAAGGSGLTVRLVRMGYGEGKLNLAASMSALEDASTLRNALDNSVRASTAATP